MIPVVNSMMIGLMMIWGMVALSCSPRVPGGAQEDHSGLSGIYDDKYLLRLAEVQLPIEERTATRPGSKGMRVVLLDVPRTYRFEICDASGESCVGVFENHEGEDVLIEITKVDSLQLDRAEYNELAGKIEEHFNVKIADLQQKVATMTVPLAIRRLAVPIALVLGPLSLGLSEGANEILYPPEHRLEDAISATAAAMDAVSVLPKYLSIENGLLSTDPDNHVSVVGDPKADVEQMVHALAAHINNTAVNQDPNNTGVVKEVCLINRSLRDGKFCREFAL